MAKKRPVKRAANRYEQVRKSSPPGEGSRFEALTETLRARGAKNPRALAAYIGRKRYGKRRFQQMAAAGRRRKSR